MKRIVLSMCTIFMVFVTQLALAQMGFKNPVIKGFNPDPSICRVGDDFYLVTSSFEYFPGLPIYHSKDLVNWRQIGHCLTRESQLKLQDVGSSRGLFAPSIRYHDGLYYVICTNVSDKGNFYCTAENPAGPWSDPVWVDIKSIDPDIFWDEDGKSYFVTQGEEGIGVTEIELLTGKLLSNEKLVWAGTGGRFPEAPHIYKKDDYYYLLLGEGGTEYAHSASIGRSRSIWGPYESCPLNPILSHSNRRGQANPIQGVGHADFIQAADGSWWTVFLGFRVTHPYSYYHILGRETFLAPVSWPKNGWPQVNGNGTIQLDMNVPTLPKKPFAVATVRDDFDSETLNLQWQYLRNPDSSKYAFNTRMGSLCMWSSLGTLNETKPLSFIGRRQTEHDFEASTALEFFSDTEFEEAGMTLLQTSSHHYDFFIRRKGNGYCIQLRAIVGSLKYIVAEREISTNQVVLKIKGTAQEYQFGQIDPKSGRFESIGKLDTRYLSTEVAGGFTGVMIGLYSTSNGYRTKAKVFYDWFDYFTS
ncbi:MULTISPECIES: glycoside hydrolase family 43 protein [Sphingobacterium]|uniref:glycoside hydrolase family 43 protein n=1 Tax=Sphingobacterium TaxID=28453 RepID=UPI0010429A8F|nr:MULTISPECIES: glycoside hydrolase family 43 protein [Sphingobacterium]MCW2263057.1 alpha-N-arabinofuranosidase [Sphingobacterium kitahiroshimense]TCR11953.1 alpha-N-arabinofuranosidase [Sphingobacterium sp. JUb78]